MHGNGGAGLMPLLYERPPGAIPFGTSRGLGDTAAKVIKWLTFGKVKPCGRCRKRQKGLNRLWPYR